MHQSALCGRGVLVTRHIHRESKHGSILVYEAEEKMLMHVIGYIRKSLQIFFSQDLVWNSCNVTFFASPSQF